MERLAGGDVAGTWVDDCVTAGGVPCLAARAGVESFVDKGWGILAILAADGAVVGCCGWQLNIIETVAVWKGSH